MKVNSEDLVWPPSYVIKKHHLAKHIKLRTSEEHGLIITLPKRARVNIPELLEENKVWIVKQLQKIHKKEITKPTQIVLLAIAVNIEVQYIRMQSKLKIIERPHNSLVLIGNVDDINNCLVLLTKWVKKKARIILLEALTQLSQKTNLLFTTANIKNQKSLWGSCTHEKVINLNYKLIFLPAHLMRHVIIHELCHTLHLNHSSHFWHLVENFDPNWQQHRRELKKADDYIPDWIS